MSSYLPAMLLALFAGVVADRSDRRRIMLTADALRAAVVLMIPLSYWAGILSPALLAADAFALAVAATFFNPARDALVPRIVLQNGLLRANSLIQTSWQFSLLIGPALAAMLLHLVGRIHIFSFDSLAYLLSFAFIFGITIRKTTMAGTESHPTKRGYGWGEVKAGLQYAASHPVILPLLLITIADNLFIMGPAIVGTPVFVKEELNLGAEAYALIQACIAVGMLIGTAGLIAFGGRFKKGRVLLVGMVLDGLTFVPLYFIGSLWGMAATIVVHSLAIPLLTISRTSLIQALVPARMTGRMFALVNLAVVGMSALSAGLSGIALETWGARVVFLVIGIGGGACGVIGWLLARKLREQD